MLIFQIANILGGQGTTHNMVPMSPKLNMGEYKSWESDIKSYLNSSANGWIEVEIVLDYEGPSSRWSFLHYKGHFYQDGKYMYSKSGHFKNELPQY